MLGEIVSDERLDPAFRALMLAVPGENDVAREIGENVDPDAIAAASRAVRAGIGGRLRGILSAILDAEDPTAPFAPDAAGAGRRSLANVAADLLATTGEPEALERVARRFDQATNMTDRLAALATLVHRGAPTADAALARFFDRFGGVPLALDKWLSVQATAPHAGALERVRTLTGHPAFSFRNPNRTRALVGSFATLNPTQFAKADGTGFDFVADAVMTLDDINPQVARASS